MEAVASILNVFLSLLFPLALSACMILFISGHFRKHKNGIRLQKAGLRMFYITAALFFLVHELHLIYSASEIFTSSGDVLYRCTPASRMTGYILIGLVFGGLVLSDFSTGKKSTRFMLPLSILLGLLMWMNTQAIVIGTNGMRVYYYHFRSVPGIGSCYVGKLDDRPALSQNIKAIYWGLSETDGNLLQQKGDLITELVISKNRLTFMRPGNKPFSMWHHFLFWKMDLRFFLRMMPSGSRFSVRVVQ